jgi:hypothetical protein
MNFVQWFSDLVHAFGLADGKGGFKENSFPGLWIRLEHFDCACTSSWQFTASGLMSGVLIPVTVQVRTFRDVTSRSLAEVCGINTSV